MADATIDTFRDAVARAVATQDGGDTDDEIEALYDAVQIAATLLGIEVPLSIV